MPAKTSTAARAEDPSNGDEGAPDRGSTSSTGPENPDLGDSNLDALSVEAEYQAVLVEAGVSDDLLSLRDEVEATLLAASGLPETLADAPSTGGIVGVGIGLGDPDSIALGDGSPGKPSLTLFTESVLSQEALLSQLAKIAGTNALSHLSVQQVPVGVVDAYAIGHRGRHRPAPGGVSVAHVKVTAGTLGSRAIGLAAPWNNRHLILSNNHVLANSNNASVGDSIVQPGQIGRAHV